MLAVRQSGIFTAVIQPPLILFCAVPGAYFLFHGAKFTGVKDLLINCGYPLIERFPLMLFTSAGVLLVGLIRWYLGRFQSQPRPKPPTPATPCVSTDGGRARVGRQADGAVATAASADAETVEQGDQAAGAPRRTPSSGPHGRPRPSADER